MAGWLDVIVPIIAGVVADRAGGSGSGDTPNQYPVELTPEQRWVFDQIKNTYEAGGSPNQQFVSGYGKSFLQDMPSVSNFSFMSPEMQGQSFAGGMKPPTIDFSQFTRPSTPPTGGGQPPLGPGSGGNRDDGGGIHPRDVSNSLPGGAGASGMESPMPPGGVSAVTGRGFDEAPPDGISTETSNSFGQWWAKFKAEHPNWATIGPAAIMAAAGGALGLGASAVASLLQYWIKRENTAAAGRLPPASQQFGDVMAKSPGVAGTYDPKAVNAYTGPVPSTNYGPQWVKNSVTGKWEYKGANYGSDNFNRSGGLNSPFSGTAMGDPSLMWGDFGGPRLEESPNPLT